MNYPIMRKKVFITILPFVCLLLCAACSQGIDKKKFEKINHTALAVKESIASGADHKEFGNLVQRLSHEVDALKRHVHSQQEKELLKAYAELLSIYKDGFVLLKYKIEYTKFGFVPRGLIYVGQDIEPIVEKYRLTTESHIFKPTQQAWKSIPEDSIQVIWANADIQLKVINGLLND